MKEKIKELKAENERLKKTIKEMNIIGIDLEYSCLSFSDHYGRVWKRHSWYKDVLRKKDSEWRERMRKTVKEIFEDIEKKCIIPLPRRKYKALKKKYGVK